MSVWDGLRGNERSLSALKRTALRKEPAHAYLFSGPAGSGRAAAALAFASALNCEEGGCGECANCRMIRAGTHPLLARVAPQGRHILIEQIRDLVHRLGLKSGQGWRVAVIEEAESMQAPAANALLKTLEEPHPRSVLILLAANRSGLLPTISSRCQLIPFRPPCGEETASELVLRGVDFSQAERLTRISGGHLARALRWIEDESLLSWRGSVLDAARAIARGELQDMVALRKELLAPLEGLASRRGDEAQSRASEMKEFALDSAHRKRVEKEGAQQARRAADREETAGLQELAFVLASWCRDLLLVAEGSDPSTITNSDRLDDLSRLSVGLDRDTLVSALDAISGAEGLLGYNIESGLWIESLLVKLEGCFAARR